MTDIVERLRNYQDGNSYLMEAAAHKIERLLVGYGKLREEIIALLHIANRDEAEIERLREEVDFLRSCCSGLSATITKLHERIAELEGK